MRILLLTSLFDPEHAIKGLSFVRALAHLGHEVEVITTFPNYPGGRIFPGYRMTWRQVENMHGIRVIRLPTFVSHDSSVSRRALSYLSFAFIAGLAAITSRRRPDIVYAYHPPLAAGLAAVAARVVRGVPFIYDVQDLWPEALVAAGAVQEGRWSRGVEKLVGWILTRAVKIVVISDGYRAALVRKGVPREKLVRIYNWSDEARCSPAGAASASDVASGTFRILYAGNLGKAQALTHVLDAADRLRSRGSHAIRFRFVGAGVEAHSLKAKAAALRLTNVEFEPRVEPEQLAAVLADSDALLLHLADSEVFRMTIPSKLQTYLAAGKPILAALAGEGARLVEDAGAGIVATPEDAEAIAAVAERMASLPASALAAMGESAARFYRAQLSQAAGIAATERVLQAAVGA